MKFARPPSLREIKLGSAVCAEKNGEKAKMKKNMNTFDRLVRLAIAILFFIMAYKEGSWLLFLAGGFIFFEAVFSWCIVYQILGKNSCPRK